MAGFTSGMQHMRLMFQTLHVYNILLNRFMGWITFKQCEDDRSQEVRFENTICTCSLLL